MPGVEVDHTSKKIRRNGNGRWVSAFVMSAALAGCAQPPNKQALTACVPSVGAAVANLDCGPTQSPAEPVKLAGTTTSPVAPETPRKSPMTTLSSLFAPKPGTDPSAPAGLPLNRGKDAPSTPIAAVSATNDKPTTDKPAAEPVADPTTTASIPPAAPTKVATEATRGLVTPPFLLSSEPFPAAEVDRTAVLPKIASAATDLPGSVAKNGLPVILPSKSDPVMVTGDKVRDRKPGHNAVPTLLLKDAVAYAVLSHPLMGQQAAKLKIAGSDVKFAEGALNPNLTVYTGVGPNLVGTYTNYPKNFGNSNVAGTFRTDVGFTYRQLVFDFGAARAEVARNQSLVDSERLKLADAAEDIALRTVTAYLNLLEQSELLGLIDKTVAEQNKLAEIVQLNQQNGNGTKADVDRIRGKVIEIQATRTDINSAYHVALDEFHRLTNLEPRQVHRPRSILTHLPKSLDAALVDARTSNPALLAIRAEGQSYTHQIESTRAATLPRIDIQGDGLVKNYNGNHVSSTGVVDVRGMVMLTYKAFDGGIFKAQENHAREAAQANTFKLLDEQETIELNLRRLFESLSANRAKRAAAESGVTTANSVASLYLEQFKAGKRTIFEVIDSNMLVFTMKKNQINGQYEELRASYGILRNTGRLSETVCSN